MKNLLRTFALILISLLVLPACSTTDSLDEVVQINNANALTITGDGKPEMPKPGGNKLK